MEMWQIAIVGGIAGFLGALIAQRRARKTAHLDVLPVLQQRGPSTIPEIMEALGIKGFSAQGRVTMAVGALVQAGRVEELPVPDGTPQLQKIKVRKYAAKP
jgi:hypothetical protein